MEVILFQPEIPQNTGSIARTCAATGTRLTLVRPLGFSLSSRRMKRAGLDYWNKVAIQQIDSLDSYLKEPFYFFSTKATHPYTEIAFEKDALLVFGSESNGLPPEIHKKWPDHFYTIPMAKEIRSLNLSNTVAIVLYEALRQGEFFT